MKLGKPPVIEAWIEFRFEPREDAPLWERVAAERFFRERLGGRYSVRDYLLSAELTVKGGGPLPDLEAGTAHIERCRAFNDAGDRAVQVGRDVLVFNLLRKGNAWPQYSVLRDEALQAHEEYVDHAKPTRLVGMAIHYRDLVAIPGDPTGRVRLEDFVLLYPEVPPDVFGAVSSLFFRVALPEFAEAGELRVEVRSEPPPRRTKEAAELRYRIDWEIRGSFAEPMGLGNVRAWLDRAHDDLTRGFREVLTPRAWALFDPEEGEA